MPHFMFKNYKYSYIKLNLYNILILASDGVGDGVVVALGGGDGIIVEFGDDGGSVEKVFDVT